MAKEVWGVVGSAYVHILSSLFQLSHDVHSLSVRETMLVWMELLLFRVLELTFTTGNGEIASERRSRGGRVEGFGDGRHWQSAYLHFSSYCTGPDQSVLDSFGFMAWSSI